MATIETTAVQILAKITAVCQLLGGGHASEAYSIFLVGAAICTWVIFRAPSGVYTQKKKRLLIMLTAAIS